VASSNDIQPSLDDVDHAILAQLRRDGRLANNALAQRVGVAPSTCLNRVRRLQEIGAIRGVHADVDPSWLGRPIQTMIAIRLRPDARAAIETFSTALATLPSVIDVYFVSGGFDFLVHVASEDTDALRDLIVNGLSSKPVVASTETYLIFEHLRGAG